jgi:hypothetical protein
MHVLLLLTSLLFFLIHFTHLYSRIKYKNMCFILFLLNLYARDIIAIIEALSVFMYNFIQYFKIQFPKIRKILSSACLQALKCEPTVHYGENYMNITF